MGHIVSPRAESVAGTLPWLDPNGLQALLGTVMAECIMYGVHLVLFMACIYFLVARRMRLAWIMRVGTVVMFILSTGDLAISMNIVVGKRTPAEELLLRAQPGPQLLRMLYPRFLIYATNNLIGVSLLIARFYIVWGQRTYLLLLAVPPLFVATGLGYSLPINDIEKLKWHVPAFFLINLVLNSALTLLTAWKVWAISHNESGPVPTHSRKQYRLSSAIIVESGMLYSLSILLTIALSSTPWVTIAAGITLHMVCVAPILMVVQISIGHAIRRRPQTGAFTAQQTHDIRTSVVLDTIVRTHTGADHDDVESSVDPASYTPSLRQAGLNVCEGVSNAHSEKDPKGVVSVTRNL